MVHLKTRDIKHCSGKGFLVAVNNCVYQLKLLGYKRADELTPAERTFLKSTPKTFEFKGEIKNR